MRVAILHDALTEFGGAERVLRAMTGLFPRADIFTAYAAPDIIRDYFPHLPAPAIHTSFAQPLHWQTHSSLTQMAAPVIWKTFDLRSYDLIISSSAHLMPVLHQPHAVSIAYIHTPPKNIFGLEQKTPLQRLIPYSFILAAYYGSVIRKTGYILCNSHHMSRMLRDLFNVQSSVLYPPVDMPSGMPSRKKGEYFLIVSRLDSGKRIELAIEACNRLKKQLVVIGRTNDDRYERFLRTMAGPTIRFTGFLPDQSVAEYYEHATAFLFPSPAEDFGIAPVEAMAYGVPVIAYSGGGVTETVVPGETGEFFREQTVDALASAVRNFHPGRYRPPVLSAHARKFSPESFRKKLKTFIRHRYPALPFD